MLQSVVALDVSSGSFGRDDLGKDQTLWSKNFLQPS